MSKRKYEDWAEKHRPKSLKRVVGNEGILSDLKRFVKNDNFPNILAIGTPGVGKTTTMKLLVKELKVPSMEINASLDSGISVVRNEISDYARQMDIDGAPYKVIILDQVDRLTKDAQQASLQLAEEVSGYCKFLATSNDVRNLHEAFVDRFKTYRFEPINVADMVKRLNQICRKEKIRAESEDLYIISKASRGSLRMAIKTLQAAAEGKNTLDSADVKAWTWVPPYGKIKKCVDYAIDGDFRKSIKTVNDILKNTQVKWFFLGITDQLYKPRKFSNDEQIIISTLLPQGNPHSMVDQDVYRFLAQIARAFQ